jgi:hypothetical protein
VPAIDYHSFMFIAWNRTFSDASFMYENILLLGSESNHVTNLLCKVVIN